MAIFFNITVSSASFHSALQRITTQKSKDCRQSFSPAKATSKRKKARKVVVLPSCVRPAHSSKGSKRGYHSWTRHPWPPQLGTEWPSFQKKNSKQKKTSRKKGKKNKEMKSGLKEGKKKSTRHCHVSKRHRHVIFICFISFMMSEMMSFVFRFFSFFISFHFFVFVCFFLCWFVFFCCVVVWCVVWWNQCRFLC